MLKICVCHFLTKLHPFSLTRGKNKKFFWAYLMTMKVFSLPWQGKDCPKTGTKGKEDLGGGGNPHLKKINTRLTKGKVSCSFLWIKVRVLSICLWSVFLGWTIGVCSVGGQVSISFLVLVLWSEVWILVCSSGHWASVTSFSETHRSLADRFCFAYSTIPYICHFFYMSKIFGE